MELSSRLTIAKERGEMRRLPNQPHERMIGHRPTWNLFWNANRFRFQMRPEGDSVPIPGRRALVHQPA